jgi:redox-sensitive bicupin YhaK (pirin superfamily)
MHYGVLRVMNDDLIQGHSGFDTHPHRNMEIITYIIHGELTHEDSIGNKESLGRGSMQYLSACTGITHSEKNEDDEEVHLIQTWILPNAKDKTPRYGSKIYDAEARQNQWLHLVAPEGVDGVTPIYQDANMYVTELDNGKKLDFELGGDRQVYLKVMEGEVSVNDFVFREGDAAEIADENIMLKGISHAHILLVEMKKG